MSTARMTFGRHRGQRIDELPDDYLDWLHALEDLREPLRSAVRAEYRRREAEGCASHGTPLALTADDRAVAEKLVSAGFRKLAAAAHPDHGGQHSDMVRLARVRDALVGALR